MSGYPLRHYLKGPDYDLFSPELMANWRKFMEPSDQRRTVRCSKVENYKACDMLPVGDDALCPVHLAEMYRELREEEESTLSAKCKYTGCSNDAIGQTDHHYYDTWCVEHRTKQEMEDDDIYKGTSYEKLGKEIGALVDKKQLEYGDSFGRAGSILRILYPNGVDPSNYGDVLAVARIIDKLFRIAVRAESDVESPYVDIAGYGLLGARASDKAKVHSLNEDDRQSVRPRRGVPAGDFILEEITEVVNDK